MNEKQIEATWYKTINSLSETLNEDCFPEHVTPILDREGLTRKVWGESVKNIPGMQVPYDDFVSQICSAVDWKRKQAK